MQPHIGLLGFTEGETLRYSYDTELAGPKPPLFPEQEYDDTDIADNAGRRGRPGCNELEVAQQRLNVSAAPWQQCVLVNSQGWACTRRHPTVRQRRAGTYAVPIYLAKGVDPRQRPFPLARQVPITSRPQHPLPAPRWLVDEVHKERSSFQDCITPPARTKLEAATLAARRDETILANGPVQGHRQRARRGERVAEVRIGPDQFHRTVNTVLREGYTIEIPEHGRPQIRELRRLRRKDWGFNADQLLADAQSINWPEQELLYFLEYGFSDYSGSAPPVCSFSPHQQKALVNLPAFRLQVQQEIDKGWIGPPLSHPPAIPFQVKPGSLEPKTGGRFRLVWNASWPTPGSRDSAVQMGNQWIPIATNTCTVLPAELAFEWSAIEANNAALDIMADGARFSGAPLLGRTFDLTKWFRQLAMANTDLWKCSVYVNGGFREDRRMQMGRRSSAHSGQRTTFLLTAMLQRAAHREQWGLIRDGEPTSNEEKDQQQKLRSWLEQRARIGPNDARLPPDRAAEPAQDSLVFFSSFQDDIAVMALGERAARDAARGVPRILSGRYEVEISDKEEASRDFSPKFTAIGAAYDTSNPRQVVCGPRKEKIEKYKERLQQLRRAGPLIPLLEMQQFVGLHTFMARFLEGGEFYCNSAYCCLRAIPNTKKEMRPVSRALLKDATTVLNLLQENKLAPLTDCPLYMHPGLQGFSSDASGSAEASAIGWGLHIHGAVLNGKWSNGIKHALRLGKISISPLELLAAAIALKVALQYRHKLPKSRRIILRSDSDSACAVVSSRRADSAPMLEALRIFKEVEDGGGVRVRLQYIPTQDNSIADSLSRGATARAHAEVQERYNVETARAPPELEAWYSRVLNASLQADRHGADSGL